MCGLKCVAFVRSASELEESREREREWIRGRRGGSSGEVERESGAEAGPEDERVSRGAQPQREWVHFDHWYVEVEPCVWFWCGVCGWADGVED